MIGRVSAALLALAAAAPAEAQGDGAALTAARFRSECLYCHARAAPEGLAPEIMAGLRPVAGLRPRDAMPGLFCRRRCTRCGSPDGGAAGAAR